MVVVPKISNEEAQVIANRFVHVLPKAIQLSGLPLEAFAEYTNDTDIALLLVHAFLLGAGQQPPPMTRSCAAG